MYQVGLRAMVVVDKQECQVYMDKDCMVELLVRMKKWVLVQAHILEYSVLLPFVNSMVVQLMVSLS